MAFSAPERSDLSVGLSLQWSIGGTFFTTKHSTGLMCCFIYWALQHLRCESWLGGRVEWWFVRSGARSLLGGTVVLCSLLLAGSGHLWQPALSERLIGARMVRRVGIVGYPFGHLNPSRRYS